MRNYLTDELEVAPALDSQLRDAAVRHSLSSHPQAVLAIRPGRPWPTQTRSWPTQTARIIPMIPTYTTSVVLPKICLAFDWPTQTKIPRTAPVANPRIEDGQRTEQLMIVSCTPTPA